MIIQVDAGSYFMVGFIALSMTLFALLLFFIALKNRSIADRYRLKYTFDRELESKEFGNDTEKMDKREKYFKKRTYRD